MQNALLYRADATGSRWNSSRSSAGMTRSASEVELTIGETQYVLVPNDENFLGQLSLESQAPFLAVVYITTPGDTITASTLKDFRATELERDDVFQTPFYENIIFYGSDKDNVNLKLDALEELAHWKTKTHNFVKCEAGYNHPKSGPGPYVRLEGATWQPWKVYNDYNQCFMNSYKPAQGHILDTPTGGTGGRVIVPSRCYSRPSESKPLAGARITVKDNIDIAGHKTTLCNRSWAQLYPPANKTAHCVQVLIDAGAVIVGKVKLQAMIMREEPQECIEFSAPFNPRADGYQVPSGSSHASAAGIGSYDWLDYSLGSDTNGSGRKPASYNGCFSIRPSTGIMDTSGVIGQFPQFDMPVFFGRDISRFSKFISVWYGYSPMLRTPSTYSVKILYPLDYLPTVNAAQTALIERFVKGLEASVDTKRTEISLAEVWKEERPAGEAHSDIAEYLHLAGGYPYYRDSYLDLGSFRDEYRAKYGKPPFVQHAMRWQWSVAKTITANERDKFWRRSELYRHWLLNSIFKAHDESEVTVMIFPIEKGEPNYREAEIPPLAILPGFASLNMAPMMRAPEVTGPVGDIPYESWVTGREEPLPIAVSVIGAPGTDLILPELMRKGMQAAGLATQVKTGRSMF